MLYPTGLYVPTAKRSLFMVTFEDKLISAYNFVPFFGSANRNNFCEVTLNYLGNKSYKPTPFILDFKNALDYLRENMGILDSRNLKRKKNQNLKPSLQVINLEEDSDEGIVDLIDNECDPEVIVLEDSIRGSQEINTDCSVIDLSEINEFPKTPKKRKASENEIIILNVKTPEPQTSPIQSTPKSEMNNVKNSCVKSRRKRKAIRKKIISGKSNTRTISNSSGSLLSLSQKKRKLQDISNTHSTASCSTSPTLVQSSGLSENILKYYKNISIAVEKSEKDKKKVSRRRCSLRRSPKKDAKRKNKSPTTKISSPRPITSVERRLKKRKVFTPQNSLRQKSSNHQRSLLQISLTNQNSHRSVQEVSPRRTSNRILCQQKSTSVKNLVETNAFNPYPCEVDLEGLRPVIIDGCNVAIRHGKGKFSPKGLKICVDYFAARGHSKIKVFLPQFRQEEFSAEFLEALKTKSDVVFTPSQNINGRRRTPYDDRFIVQYATEFGGVIVSTDNYRDLLRENLRWQQTIEQRLLMFTWVDDFLMFPLDPLGRSGPTLEEFLRF